ncbi:hypothetical protein F4775DRAFT_526491 [Biscogniauxia sp. FL1348]|nr:hypothetical protein F4775DRAFT_526491 [Biscogniauxia sp. FL1348]
MTSLSHNLPQDMTEQGPSQQFHLLWSDDIPERGDLSESINEGCDTPGSTQELEFPRGAKKRTLVRPQVTVNVFSSGGSSSGGSGAGGAGSGAGGTGTGGAVTVGGDGVVGHVSPVSGVEAQLADLSRRVEQLLCGAAARELVVETGVWNTMEVRPWNRPEQSTSAWIKFSKKFHCVPAVTVSICAADMSRDQNVRIKVYATDINSDGFHIHAESWFDTVLYSCGVAWTAIGG